METPAAEDAAAAFASASVAKRRTHCWYGNDDGDGDCSPVASSIRNALSAIVSHYHHGSGSHPPRPRRRRRKEDEEEDKGGKREEGRRPSSTAAALYLLLLLRDGGEEEDEDEEDRGVERTTRRRGPWRLVATHQIDEGGAPPLPCPFPRTLPAVALGGRRGDRPLLMALPSSSRWKLLAAEERGGSSLLLVAQTASAAKEEEEEEEEEQRRTKVPHALPPPDGWIRVLAGLSSSLLLSPAAPPARPSPPACDLAGMAAAVSLRMGPTQRSSPETAAAGPSPSPKYFYPIEVGDAVGAAVEDEDSMPGRAVGDREKIVCGIKALAALAGEKSQVTLRGSARELRVIVVAPSSPSPSSFSSSSSLSLPHPLPSLTLTLPLVAAPAPAPAPVPPPRKKDDAKKKKTKAKKEAPPRSPPLLLCQTAAASASAAASHLPPLATADDGDSYACRARYYLDAKKGRHRRQGQGEWCGGGGAAAAAAAAIRPFPTQQLVAIYHPKESVRSAAAIAAEDRGCTPLTLSTYAETRRLILSGGTRGLVAILADADSLPRLRRSVEKAGLASLVRVAAIPALVATGDAPGAAPGLLPPLLPSFECAVSDALGFERRRIRRILVAIRQDAGILGEMLDRALAPPSSSSSSSSSLPPPVVAVITRQPRDTEVSTTMMTLSSEYDLIFADECPDERQGREKGMEFARRIRSLAPSPRDAPVLVAIVDRSPHQQQRQQRQRPPSSSSSFSSSSPYSSSSSSSDEGDVDGGPLTAVFDYVLHRPFSLDRVRNVVSSAERALLRRNAPAPPR